MIVFLNGRYVDEGAARISIFDQGFLYGDGVYETMRTYRGKLWRVDAHLKRLEKSLDVAGMKLPYAGARLIDQIRLLIRKNGFREARVRVMVTRGASESKGARFAPKASAKATVCIVCYPLPVFTGKEKLREVSVDFFPVERAFPTVKTISLFPMVMARMHAYQRELYDVLLVDREGYVSEGAVSNVFVVRRGVLYTPRKGILMGVAREVVLRVARRLVRGKKLKKIVYCFFKKSFVRGADEVFLSNAPAGVVAVTKIGGKVVGKGRVGTLTKAVFEGFRERL
jgi:branched-chain amino acid aminotransferase